jgi:hypothetical protein
MYSFKNMTENITLPPNLNAAIGSEKKDFAVKAGRAQPRKNSISTIRFGVVWTAFTSIFVFTFLGPLFQGEEVHYELNGVPTVASPDDLDSILMPGIIIVVFVLIGISVLSWGIYLLFKKGGYFVGTPIRLVHYQNGNIRSIDWEQFSGEIELNGNDHKGNISLQMRTGRMVSSKKEPDRYVPDVIYISEISNVFEVEQICRRRIKENDPTPPTI